MDRDDPGEDPTLVYDAMGKYVLCYSDGFGYSVFGNQLFFPLVPVIEEVLDGQRITSFNLAGDLPMMRIDLTTGEEEIIRFE